MGSRSITRLITSEGRKSNRTIRPEPPRRPQTPPRKSAKSSISGASHPNKPVEGDREKVYVEGETSPMIRKSGALSTFSKSENTPEGKTSRASRVSATHNAPATEPVSATASPKVEFGARSPGVHIAITAPSRPSSTPMSSCLCIPDPATSRDTTSITPCALLNKNAFETLVYRNAIIIDALHHICAQLARNTCQRSRRSSRKAAVQNTPFALCRAASKTTMGITARVHVCVFHAARARLGTSGFQNAAKPTDDADRTHVTSTNPGTRAATAAPSGVCATLRGSTR
mmetsp:Transcript_2033/g.5415  ORF Transcript_2033/g.5415 Transcript_2033/m.5415 type:complete len:286 (+) Transcript_2033:216-1073(+)